MVASSVIVMCAGSVRRLLGGTVAFLSSGVVNRCPPGGGPAGGPGKMGGGGAGAGRWLLGGPVAFLWSGVVNRSAADGGTAADR